MSLSLVHTPPTSVKFRTWPSPLGGDGSGRVNVEIAIIGRSPPFPERDRGVVGGGVGVVIARKAEGIRSCRAVIDDRLIHVARIDVDRLADLDAPRRISLWAVVL